MGVSLYTSRIVLQILGVEDYGIYNVVSGAVILFSFFNASLTASVQRFITIAIGQKDDVSVSKIYWQSYYLYIIVSIMVIVLAETFGLWYLNFKMMIPENKIFSANIVYQLSLLNFIVSSFRTADQATVISLEKMSFFAYVSIFEVILKLFSVLLLFFIGNDKLIYYSLFLLITTGIVNVVFHQYVRKKIIKNKIGLKIDRKTIGKLASFSGWSLFGNAALVSSNQGVNLVLNLFFGVVVNAAMGIANQVSSIISQLVSSFQLAFTPQITKLYAEGKNEELFTLMFRTSKISFFLVLIFAIPLLLYMPILLKIWLINVPEYTVNFSRLIVIYLLIDTLSGPFWTVANATGKIKNYQIILSLFHVLNIFFSYILLSFGSIPEVSLFVKIFISVILLFIRLYFMKNLINFPVHLYLWKVISSIILIAFLSFALSYFLKEISNNLSIFIHLFLISISILFTGFFSFIFGFDLNEKKFLTSQLKNKLLGR